MGHKESKIPLMKYKDHHTKKLIQVLPILKQGHNSSVKGSTFDQTSPWFDFV